MLSGPSCGVPLTSQVAVIVSQPSSSVLASHVLGRLEPTGHTVASLVPVPGICLFLSINLVKQPFHRLVLGSVASAREPLHVVARHAPGELAVAPLEHGQH